MVFYIFLVAVLNLGLGFAVAAVLARRCPEPEVAAGDLPDFEHETDSPALEENAAEAPASSADHVLDTSVTKLRGTVEHYNRQLADIDEQLRGSADSGEAANVKTCLDSLCAVSEEYLAARGEAYEAFQQEYGRQQGFQPVCDALEKAMDIESSQIRETNAAIEDFDCEADLEEGYRRILGHTVKLLGTTHQVRDVLDGAVAAAVRSEDRLDAPDAPGCKDLLTGLVSRVGLEKELDKWWGKDSHQAKPVCVAMIDLDQFGRVNEQHGQKAGNRVLRAIGHLLATEGRHHAAAVRLSGQQFLLVFPESDARFATNIIERIRQLIEVSHFRCGERDIQVTVSCAVIEGTTDAAPDSLLALAEATLREAKRYGRNRTFLEEGGYPSPVVPPNFSLEDRSITI